MKTIKRENRIPRHIAVEFCGSRNFRIQMRRAVAQARKAIEPLGTLGTFTPAGRSDIHDVQVLLNRIRLDLSQENWGK